MDNKLVTLIFLATLSINILTGCGTDAGNVSDLTNTIATADAHTDVTDQAQPTVSSTDPKTTSTTKKPSITTSKTETTAKIGTIATLPQTSASVAQKIISKTKQTYDGYKNFTATLTMFSKRNDKVAPTALATATAEFKYTFQQQPKLYLFTVIKHSISLAIGGRLVWAVGDTKAKAKGAGALGIIPLTLELSDSKIETNRSWRLDQMDQFSILGRALDPKATVTLIGKSTVGGKDAYVIQVKGNGIDDQITEEDISIDAQNFTLLADEAYVGKDLVFQEKLTMLSTNDTLPSDTFTL